MFGLLQPCRRRLGPELHNEWKAHLCGTCLAAGKGFGSFARASTNVDGLLTSVLVSAQQERPVPLQRGGRCPLRSMRAADVVAPDAAGPRYAASVSLFLAGTKIADQVVDGDLPLAVRPAARRVAARWTGQGAASAAAAGLDAGTALALLERQPEVEAGAGPGDLLAVTASTEAVTAQVLATTATIAGRPVNREPLAEVGRMFGRVAHVLDAVGDLEEDRRRGTWNPLIATGTGLEQAREVADDAVRELKVALDRVEFTEPALARHLLGRELPHRVNAVFRGAGLGVIAGLGGAGGACGHRASESMNPIEPEPKRSKGGRCDRLGECCDDCHCWCSSCDCCCDCCD